MALLRHPWSRVRSPPRPVAIAVSVVARPVVVAPSGRHAFEVSGRASTWPSARACLAGLVVSGARPDRPPSVGRRPAGGQPPGSGRSAPARTTASPGVPPPSWRPAPGSDRPAPADPHHPRSLRSSVHRGRHARSPASSLSGRERPRASAGRTPSEHRTPERLGVRSCSGATEAPAWDRCGCVLRCWTERPRRLSSGLAVGRASDLEHGKGRCATGKDSDEQARSAWKREPPERLAPAVAAAVTPRHASNGEEECRDDQEGKRRAQAASHPSPLSSRRRD
jgi:hypothetical protein